MCLLRVLFLVCTLLSLATGARAASVLQELLPAETAADLVPGADGFGPIRSDLAVSPVLKGGETVAWAVITSDFVGTTG